MTGDDLRAHARYHALQALAELEQAGLIKRDTRTVLDVNQRQLMALSAVYSDARKWWRPNDNDRTLGDLLKTMPQDEADRVLWVLRWGGLLPDEEPEVLDE